jgi:hypothetical protein
MKGGKTRNEHQPRNETYGGGFPLHIPKKYLM